MVEEKGEREKEDCPVGDLQDHRVVERPLVLRRLQEDHSWAVAITAMRKVIGSPSALNLIRS